MVKKLKKSGLYKPESERTKKQKLIRDFVAYGVVIYAALMTFLWLNAETQLADAEAELANIAVASQEVMHSAAQ